MLEFVDLWTLGDSLSLGMYGFFGRSEESGDGMSLGSSNKSIKGLMDLYFNAKEHQILKRSKGCEGVTMEACKELMERAMEVEHVKKLFKPHEEMCNSYDCSLMMDKWTDRRDRAFINVIVNCPLGSYFIESIDVSKDTVDGNKMLELFEAFVNQVGKDKIVQVICDNASENVRASNDLMDLYLTLYWTPCAAHCINLMFKDISENRHFALAYKRALKLSVYIHSKAKLLNWLRKYTGKHDLVKFAKTWFTTAFLTFKRFHKQKNNLRKLFNSEEFLASSYFKEEAGKECSITVQMPNFWNTILEAHKIDGPLISIIQLVDRDVKPSINGLYICPTNLRWKSPMK
ncbi:PREDICTED: uncharacterized protein LOC109185296 [Ipomoea nil]|uniref:uncharacterized protein LOC109185296 n=1 Tax=Ipomoea nil TaxID=35883 RepID=UPI000901577B|nr:PREDICTED: uncharacterized protein LOC109185296 [Ipomoea nil]